MDKFIHENQENNIKMLKNKMSLDFNAPASQNKKAKLIKTCILESPDLKMLKFSSPELERMIIQQNGLVSTTPTPSSALTYFLKQEQEATEEQEQFSRGFVDALNQLHQTNGQQHPSPPPTHCLSSNNNHNSNTNNNQNNSHSNINSNNNQNLINTSSDSSSDVSDNSSKTNNRRNSYHMLVPSTVATSTTSTTAKFAVPQVPSSHVPTTTAANVSQTEQYVSVSSCQTTCAHVLINQSVNTQNRASVLPPYSQAVNNNSIYPMSIKVEPTQQKVNYSSMKDLSPPAQTHLAQPIDMEDQERIKLERKRLRNRIGASKCRRRKLDRISKLEDKVTDLKGENSELSIVVNKLRDQVCSLKQQVMEHVKCGCHLMATQ